MTSLWQVVSSGPRGVLAVAEQSVVAFVDDHRFGAQVDALSQRGDRDNHPDLAVLAAELFLDGELFVAVEVGDMEGNPPVRQRRSWALTVLGSPAGSALSASPAAARWSSPAR
jgi:hypothetical protein